MLSAENFTQHANGKGGIKWPDLQNREYLFICTLLNVCKLVTSLFYIGSLRILILVSKFYYSNFKSCQIYLKEISER